MPQSSSSAPGIDPIELLSQQIVPAAKRKGSIKLGTKLVKDVKDELKTVRRSKRYVLDTLVVTIVSALENYDKTCSRLDSATFSIILQTLLHAKYSRQKERGILLLTGSLYHDAHKTPPLRTIKARKTAIGKECLQALLSCFTDTLENARIRRWVGVLIPQLLEGSDHNTMAFELSPEDSKRRLGTMVVEEHNEILRVTCGQLIKALMAWDIPPEDLWPVGTDSIHYRNFPTSSQSEKHWVNAFQTYIDKLLDSSNIPQGSGRLYFAQALAVSPMGSKTSEGIISILVDGDISICTRSSDISFTESLEIPFQLISEARIEDTLLEGLASSTTSAVDLVVELKISCDVSCYMNALPVNIASLRITVKDEDFANVLGQEFLSLKSIQKVSQSQETITIASGFIDAIPPQESEVVGDSHKELTKFRNDDTLKRPREGNQDNAKSVEFSNFFEQSPQDNQTRETGIRVSPGLEKPMAEDVDSAGKPISEDNQNEAGDHVPFRPSAPARLSHDTGNDTRASADKDNDRRQDVDLQDKVSKCTRRAQPSVQLPTVPEPHSHQYFEEIFESPANPNASPIALAESKPNFTRTKVKAKLREKKTVLKADDWKEEIKEVKKYSLKPKAAVPATKAPASKRASAPKTSTARVSISKAALKVSAPEPNLTPKPALGLVVRAAKKTTSKLLVSKKPAVEDIPKQPNRQSQAIFPGLDLKSQERQNAPARPEGHAIMSLDVSTQVVPMQEGRAINCRASRLSDALADIDDIEQLDASFGELVQTSLIYQPLQVATQMKISLSPVAESTPLPAQGDTDSPRQFVPEIITVLCKNYENQPLHARIESENSPSSLVRVTPAPLLAQEASPAEYSIPEVTTVPSKLLAESIGRRRSPRLASRYSAREVSVTSLLAGNPVIINMTNNDEPQYEGGISDNNRPLTVDEAPLFDEYLARKTPLISFGTKGPRNQGISSSKKSLQKIGGIQQVEKPETHPPQTYKRIQSGKRKRDKEDAPVMENSKRRQMSRLQKSEDMTSIAKKILPLAFREEEDLIMPKNHPVARNTARFGSQGSRVNENGSPRGGSNSLHEHTDYKAIVRKVLMDAHPSVMDDEENGNGPYHYGDDEGLNVIESDQEFLSKLPTISSSCFRVRPRSPRPEQEVVKQYLTHQKNTNLQHPEDGPNAVCHQQYKLVDPFLNESSEIGFSCFARRLQCHGQTAIQKAKDDPTAPILQKTRSTMDGDPEATLVNVENDIPVRDFSSSSDMITESSDEAQDQKTHKAAIEVHQAHEEWRMALKPHQRGILDVLNQVSIDLVRHLINHEQAVEDVLTEYEQGGIKLMKNLERAHQDDRRRIQHEVDKVKKIMANGYKEARQEISRITKAIRAQPVRDLEQGWMQEQDQMQRLIEEGMRKCR